MAQVYRLPEPSEGTGRSGATLPARPERADNRSLLPLRSPVAVYLDRLSESSRRGAYYRLRAMANIVWPGVPVEDCPWHELDPGALMQLRARLVERYKPSAAMNYHATVRGVLKAAWLIGLLDADTYERLRAV